MIKIKKLKRDIKIPIKAHSSDAGFDVYAIEQFLINKGDRYCAALGFAIELPDNTVAMIQSKSGLANKFGIDTIGNIIDSGYRGECHAILVNHGDNTIKFESGDKIAQMLIIKLDKTDILQEVVELSEADRGNNKFGSSGKK